MILGRNVWDTLIVRDLDSGEFKPLLATDWEWVDNVTLDMNLRQGVTFHDGSSFEADDVVYTFSYAANPDNKIVSQQVANWIASVEKTGDYSIRIHAKAPTPYAMEFLSTQLAIQPSDYYSGPGTARAKGLPAHRVVLKHALRNALVPVVGLVTVQLGLLIGGSVVIESIFALDGLGYLAYQSISYRDFPVLQAVVLLLSVVYVVLTLLSDIVNAWLDPRLRVS